MTRALATAVLALASAGSTLAAGTGLTYHTDSYTESWLQKHVKSWQGYKATDLENAICISGYYSKREARTKKHFAKRKNSAGEYVFHTFSCSLSLGEHTFSLYLVAKPRGYSVSADR
jgi:hypothetical protein